MRRIPVFWILLAWTLLAGCLPAAAQRPDPASAATVASANAGAIGVISGGVQGTYVRIAADLATVLDDGQLRILPIIGRGSVQNIADLLFLRGVDLAIVQADVLAFMARDPARAGLRQNVQYVTKLYDEELHLLARSDVNDLRDLDGKAVNVDTASSGTAMTATLVFDALGLRPRLVHDNQAAALEKLRRGEIAALAYVAGKPAGLFAGLSAKDNGLHFLSVPMTPTLLETYLPARLEHAQYPGLVAAEAPVETVAVGAVMAVYAWPRGTARNEKVTRFVNAFFGAIGRFRLPPNHPKWAEVNLGAQLPGWVRFAAAQDALRRAASNPAGSAPGR